ncbi:protoporphyrinogen oxidase HemJ [Breoghania sp.]|uniref:protoporphyrinogen oxidase HemJ n=1 Tax=Breoghania sp. TaxID=2065378 RepID=UPI002AA62210|nr:protoporphyrinogen oxidase HemJ [Breoghania sp.]
MLQLVIGRIPVLWIKAIHIMAVISWMAGLFYLPRLMVYHVQAEPGSDKSETFKIMERRLYKAIMVPAMVVAWICGLVLAVEWDYFSEGWFHAKLLFVVILTVFNFMLGKRLKEFADDRNQYSERYFRIINEIPTLIMIAVVILVILRPF